MRIAYANAFYKMDNSGGGNAHVGQFIQNAAKLGHEIWSWSGNEHSAARKLGINYISLLRKMRTMDALYIRIERTPPSTCRWSLPPHRLLYAFPVVVWEFNTVPEYGLLRGQSITQVENAIRKFQRYGKGCDLAVCVSQALADYVKARLGIQRVAIIPNGSDPELFRPGLPPVKRLDLDPNSLQIVWIGSGDISWTDFDSLREAAWLLWERNMRNKVDFHLIGPDLTGGMGDMPPNVHYYGAERYERLPYWLSAMDVGLCLYKPGPWEYGSPLKLFDYMSSGLTVISTRQRQVNEIFNQLGQSDLLIPYNDPHTLVDVLKNLANDRERIRELGQASRKSVIDYYNWGRAVKDIMIEIETILKEKGFCEFA
jgi:glycosyltransferase involved in cell wall biosynthesis